MRLTGVTSLNTVHRQTDTTASIDQGIHSTNIMNVSPPPKLRQNVNRTQIDVEESIGLLLNHLQLIRPFEMPIRFVDRVDGSFGTL